VAVPETDRSDRRLVRDLKQAVQAETQWVVFEPNTEPTWDRARREVAAYLDGRWRAGDLVGRTPAEAYFARCDRTTMTQADVDAGQLVIVVGVAPLKPAEFVIFRIGQWTADARP
jgi:phage tail sheath protein FI